MLWDGVNYSEIKDIKITKIDTTSPDNTAPTISSKTSRTITVNFNQQDQGNGNTGSSVPDDATHREFRLYDENDNLVKTDTESYGTSSSHTFRTTSDGIPLKENTKYYVRTYAIDAVGNTGVLSARTAVTTEAIPGSTTKPTDNYSGGITLSSNPPATTLTNGSVTVTATKNTTTYPDASKYNIEMNTNGAADGGDMIDSVVVSEKNTVVYAYLTDRQSGEAKGYANRRYGATLKVTNIGVTAWDIGYTPANGNWTVDNVGDALDWLFNNL